MAAYVGMTWDHPRGKAALRAAAARLRESGSRLDIRWDAQPLEGFESHPIGDLAHRYDLIVLDHPHLGEAIAEDALQPLDELISAAQLADWARASIGLSFSSYAMFGHQWAVPLDAATQVSAYKPELVGAPPSTWDEVVALSHRVPVALSLAGPHALLTLFSLCSALEGSPVASASRLADSERLLDALELMCELTGRGAEVSAGLNPIAMFDRMRDTDEIAYCPLVYGYVNYSCYSLRFADVPRAGLALPQPGSVLGGTGLAISRRCAVTPELIQHIGLLMSSEVQCGFIPDNEGQPSAREAWLDRDVDARAHGFYSDTLATIEASFVRPRTAGYIGFQRDASGIVRDAAVGRRTTAEAVTRIRELADALELATVGEA